MRPIVLGIYSKFYIPLQEALRPATKAMILALLPGLEEEGGEFFEKVSSLLDQLSGTVSPSFFLQNIWLVLITAPSLRIAALNYLGRRMPKIGKDDSIGAIVGDDVGLMVRGFSAALEDGQILVQRAALDLVIATLPTDGAGFQKDTRRKEQLLLMRAMTGVVLRRDLSLSRRLYSWLLGSAEDSDSQVEHLRKNGLALLREALVEDIDDPEVDSGDLVRRQRPYKVVLSLLDKWEISFPLTEVIVLDLLRALHRSLNNGELHDEVREGSSAESSSVLPKLSVLRLLAPPHGHHPFRRVGSLPYLASTVRRGAITAQDRSGGGHRRSGPHRLCTSCLPPDRGRSHQTPRPHDGLLALRPRQSGRGSSAV